MTRSAFLQALLWDLRLRGLEPVRTSLEVFLSDCRPLIEEDPDVASWAREYLARREEVGIG